MALFFISWRRHGAGRAGTRDLFAGDDSVGGANLGASATLDAGIGIDVVDITFRNSLYGAVGQTGATGDTLVGNYVSHCQLK